MRISIGIPISRKFDWRANLAQIYATVDALQQNAGLDIIAHGNHERPTPIVDARNIIAERFMENGSDYLLWLDSDATAVPGMLTRLLSYDAPIVSALCFKRKYPVTPACGIRDTDPDAGPYSYPPPINEIAAWVESHEGLADVEGAHLMDWEPDGLLPVDVVGTHYTLVKREVFEALPQPWYVRTTDPDVGSTGSDWYFCKQAREAGFPVYVDLTAISGHLEGSHCISVYDFVAWTIVIRYSEFAKKHQKERE